LLSDFIETIGEMDLQELHQHMTLFTTATKLLLQEFQKDVDAPDVFINDEKCADEDLMANDPAMTVPKTMQHHTNTNGQTLSINWTYFVWITSPIALIIAE
jgi:hypothetical protein